LTIRSEIGTDTASYFLVIDWTIWDGKYFGDPFEPDALKKKRGYKKWAEMLLHPELKGMGGRPSITNAAFYLDRLGLMYGYDVVSHLEDRFTRNYVADSWKDAIQGLQLCDLLTGCLSQ